MQPNYSDKDISDNRPYLVLIGEPTIKQVQHIAILTVRNILNKMGIPIISYNKTEKIIEFQGKKGITKLLFFSYESGEEKVEGFTGHYAVLDEFFQCQEQLFDQINSRLSNTDGSIICAGTIKNKSLHWIRKRLIENENVGAYTWKSEDNPYFSKQMLADLRASLSPDVFERRYNASLDRFEGQVFQNLHEIVSDFPIIVDDYYRFFVGVDWGTNQSYILAGVRHNQSIDIIATFFDTDRHIVYPVDSSYKSWLKIAEGLQNNFIQETQETFKVDIVPSKVIEKNCVESFIADPSGKAFIQSFLESGIRTQPADNNREAGLSLLKSLIHSKTIRIHKNNNSSLIEDLTSLQVHPNNESDIIKKNDHNYDALRYVCMYMAKNYIPHIFRMNTESSSDGERYIT